MYFGPRPVGLLCLHCRQELSVGSKEVNGMRVCSKQCAKQVRRIQRENQRKNFKR